MKMTVHMLETYILEKAAGIGDIAVGTTNNVCAAKGIIQVTELVWQLRGKPERGKSRIAH